MKDRFTALLSESLKDVAIDQRIILDTGDGAAISFLGDPEDALFVSMHMRDFLQRALVDASEAAIASQSAARPRAEASRITYGSRMALVS